MTTTPRTRRQLREALQKAKVDLELAEHRVSQHKIRIEDLRRDRERLYANLQNAKNALSRSGFKKVTGPVRVSTIDQMPIWSIGWQAPHPTGNITQETLNATVLEAEANTRRETLKTVINAMQLKQYLSPIPPFHSRLADGYDDAIDAFWADLNVALTVRAERKAAERRDATEAKVAGLVGIDIDTAVKVAAGVPRTVTLTDTAVSLSAGDRDLLDGIAKSATKKKPEAKK